MKKIPIIFSWSGGKDSAYALYQLNKSKKYQVKYLFTTIFLPNKRVAMHGIPEHLITEQAKSIGLPLKKLYFNDKNKNDYENKTRNFLLDIKSEGIETVAFGDIFLEDLREYREQKLAEIDMKAIFPLWNKQTNKLASTFIKSGFKTHICSIDNAKIPEHLIAQDFNSNFIKQLPKSVDPCGENGEFHSFCYDGPIFSYLVKFDINFPVQKSYEANGLKFEYTFSDIY